MIPHFQSMVGQAAQLRGTPVADPWIIAQAKTLEGCVVTEEAKNKPNAAKIPNVCSRFGIDCISVQELLKRQDWRLLTRPDSRVSVRRPSNDNGGDLGRFSWLSPRR